MSNSANIFTTKTQYLSLDPSLIVVFLNFDGNLIMRDSQKNFKWQTYTASTNNFTTAYQLNMQNDGALVILDNANKIIWSSMSKIVI